MVKERRISHPYYLWIYGLFALVSCNVKLETQIPVLPNLKGQLPNSSLFNANVNNNQAATNESRNQSNKKTAILNLTIGPLVAEEMGIQPELNCAQMVQFDTGAVLVDFANAPCPTDKSAVRADTLRFTATYQRVDERKYELFLGNTKIGEMDIDFQIPRIELIALCTRSYSTLCFISTTPEKRIDELLPL